MSTETRRGRPLRRRAASPGAYELTSATATGFVPFEPQLGHSPVTVWARAGVRLDDITIYLSPALALVVIVLDDTGKPLAAAEVRTFDDRAGPADGRGRRQRRQGRGEPRRARPSDTVEARHAGYRARAPSSTTAAQTSGRADAAPRRPAPIARASPSAATSSTRAACRSTARSSRRSRRRRRSRRSTRRPQPSGAQALSGADGRFTLAALDDGVYSVRATTRAEGLGDRARRARGRAATSSCASAPSTPSCTASCATARASR